jgi:OmpA-OmpF porin, OOP family
LLKADPMIKVYVVGHTDNVSTLDINLKLSQARADAVVQALVTGAIILASMPETSTGMNPATQAGST